MYPQFFGFDKLPFRLRPDPEFLYAGREYKQSRAAVLGALRSARVVLFMGQPGVGKTLLLDDVLREIGGQYGLCRINQPHISATELLQAVLIQLGTTTVLDADMNHARLFAELTTTWESVGGREAAPLLVIDDAQMLSAATLLTLGDILVRAPRMKLLLVGQTDQEPRGADLAARIAVAQKPREVHMNPLDAGATRAYVEHRLNVAGGGGKELFTDDAFTMIYQHTQGDPRLINVLCDAALHAACLRASGHVSAAEILAATQDARWPEAVAREKVRPAHAQASVSTADGHASPAQGQTSPVPAQASPAQAPANQANLAQAQASPVQASMAQAPASAANGFESYAAATHTLSANGTAVAAPYPDEPAHEPAADPGVKRAQLFVSHKKQHIATWPLGTGRISIGRASDNVLRLDSPVISRHHCLVVTDDGTSTVEDLGSVNGIMVNGKTVKSHVLKHADQIVIGEHVLTYVVS